MTPRANLVAQQKHLGPKQMLESVTVRKAVKKPMPAKRLVLQIPQPGNWKPVGETYLRKRLQGTILWYKDEIIAMPLSKNKYVIFAIMGYECREPFFGVYMVTPETSIEEIVSGPELESKWQ